jgi:hypothetical protein
MWTTPRVTPPDEAGDRAKPQPPLLGMAFIQAKISADIDCKSLGVKNIGQGYECITVSACADE